MRRDEDAFLRGEPIVADRGLDEMTPCGDTAFFEHIEKERVLLEYPGRPSVIPTKTRPFNRSFYCHKCLKTQPFLVDADKATCTACNNVMDVVAPISPPKSREQLHGYRPYRVGESVKAREGTKLYRYLSEYFLDPGVSLKIEECRFLDGGCNYDYLVKPVTSVRQTWMQSQLIPVTRDDIYGSREVLSEKKPDIKPEEEVEESWADKMERELLEMENEGQA